MKILLSMAMSLNGFIASKSRDEDFLSHENWLSFVDLVNKHNNFIVGRKTYDTVKAWGTEYGFHKFKNADRVILSKNTNQELEKGYILANSGKEAIEILKNKGHKTIIVTGGAEINSLFMKANLLDEIILNIEPVLLGEGIPLFADNNFIKRLSLIKIRKLKEIGRAHV